MAASDLAMNGSSGSAVDPEEFREALARSLADGSFRLVIVLDSAPDELVQVVGYLQSVTDKIDIDLVTVAVYDVAGSQVLVPQRIEPGRRTRELSDAQVTARQGGGLHPGSAEFRAVIVGLPPGRRDVLTRLADWAETLQRDGLVRLFTYRGKSGMTTLLPYLLADDAGLVAIACGKGSDYMQFWRSVFERRALFRPGISHGRFRNLKPNAANTRTMPTFTINRSQSSCLKNRTSTPTTTATSAST